ncbi:hypothetical protein D3C71_2033160 [compost metagenome]
MHDDRVDARLLQQRDIACKGAAEFGIAHGVAAVFHDDRLVLVALHVGQGLGEQACLDFTFIGGHGGPSKNTGCCLTHVSPRWNDRRAT